MRGERLGSERSSMKPQFELLTPDELAEYLKVPASWVRERTRSRDLQGDDVIPHLRLGRYIRFAWGSPELEAWLRRRLHEKSLRVSKPVC
jgi:hypothetical protein